MLLALIVPNQNARSEMPASPPLLNEARHQSGGGGPRNVRKGKERLDLGHEMLSSLGDRPARGQFAAPLRTAQRVSECGAEG